MSVSSNSGKQQTFGSVAGASGSSGSAAATMEPTAIVKDGEVEAEVSTAFAPVATGSKRFDVFYPKDNPESTRVQARDANEAWAVFCDSKRVWPSPKTGRVVPAK